MQPNDDEVQDGVAKYLENSLRTRAGLERTWLVSIARVLQQLLPRWLTQWLFRCMVFDVLPAVSDVWHRLCLIKFTHVIRHDLQPGFVTAALLSSFLDSEIIHGLINRADMLVRTDAGIFQLFI